MKEFWAVIFCLIVFDSLTLAQDDEEPKSNVNSNRKYKNEVGIDISPFKFILGDYGAGYPSVFYRRHFIREKKVASLSGVKLTTYQAWRFRIGSNLSFQNFSTPDIRNPLLPNYQYYNNFHQSLSSNSVIFVRIGKERQHRSSKFELLYGYDFFINYNTQRQYYLYVNYFSPSSGSGSIYPVNYEQKNNTSNTFVGVAGIGGFKYFLIPRLCFSAEATINLGYSKQEYYNEYNSFDTSTNLYTTESVSSSSSGLNLAINPLFLINVGYYF